MSDNTILNAGSGGDTYGSDDISGVKYQRVKLIEGADGVNDGDISSANGLPVDIVSSISLTVGSHAVTNAGTFAVQVTGDGLTALQLIDDAIYVDDADWTDNTSKHALVGGVYQSSPHTVTDGDVTPFLTDSNGRLAVTVGNTVTVGSHAVTNAGTFAVQVDGSALTALQLIDDAIYVDDADWTDDTSKHMLVGGVYQATPHTVTDGDVSPFLCDVNGRQEVVARQSFVTVQTDVTRPNDTTAYAINDCLSDSTSAPTCFTFTGAARKSGGSGIITDAMILTNNDAGTLLQGEILIFNQAVTSANDNAAWAISDSDAKFLVGKIPFTLEDIGNNGWYHAQNLNIGFTCSGSANLRFLVRVKNAYTPAAQEVFTFTLKCLQLD